MSMLNNSTSQYSTTHSKETKEKETKEKETKEKETGFFKRLFKHEKDTDEEPNKATGTP